MVLIKNSDFDSGNGECVSRVNKPICTGVTQELYLIITDLFTYCHLQGDPNFQKACFNCCGSIYNFLFLFQRLEVQADVQKERYSLSGESGTVSLGTVSDNASTKAMAGSILNSYIPLDR